MMTDFSCIEFDTLRRLRIRPKARYHITTAITINNTAHTRRI